MHKRSTSSKVPAKISAGPDSSPKLTLAQARKHTQQYPQQASGWKMLGAHLLADQPEEARNALGQALKLVPNDHAALSLAARAETALGNEERALKMLEQALELKPDFAQGHLDMAKLLHHRGKNDRALEHIQQAHQLMPRNDEMLSHKGNILYKLYRYDEAIAVFDELLKRQPKHYSHWNNAGNLRRDIGQFDRSDVYYRKAMDLAKNDAIPYSNYLTSLHYRPDYSRSAIFGVCKEWQTRYAPAVRATRPQPKDTSSGRCLKIGMFSDGFRRHPVGMMITAALENLGKHEIELYAYSTNNIVDDLTLTMQATVDHWIPIQHMSNEAFAQRIRDDEIDILLDLCGHNTGTRMQVVAMEPAPLLLKWVGGLINTTGVEAIDYLLSDNIESPQGEDEFYTEKLIRMPDDYICYTPPEYMPEVKRLPALDNGYITLGCFNNPIKVNETLLAEWAKLMHELPDSRLYLKGHQYNSEQVCRRIRDLMASLGIGEERLILEGPSKHQILLETYNRIDIALDPWPYSGGLTTCEAMLMGVPVVTLPGPTFAGRHSATHIVNAGMPELVVDSWDEYRQRVTGLASDLDSLATIRTHLRDILLQSPVCDGARFAKHFTTAMRAIWQRYCEGKSPAALSIDVQGNAWFEGDNQPMELQHPVAPAGFEEKDFNFSFNGKVITLDNGATLVGDAQFSKLYKLGAFSTIAFDPASKVSNAPALQEQGELHHFPHAVLGNGLPGTLYVCLDSALSATLEPLPAEQQLAGNNLHGQVIAKLPINTQRLDDIDGLASIDWLLLNNLSNSLEALEHGANALANTLLVQARVNFVPTHRQQPELTQISQCLSRLGFSLYRLNNLQHHSYLPKHDDLIGEQATQLTSADALFIPDAERMAKLTNNQRLKLAFVLHTVYGVHDLTYKLINEFDPEGAELYLASLKPRKPRGSSKVDTTAPSKSKAIQPIENVEQILNDAETIPVAPLVAINYTGSSSLIKNACVFKAGKYMDTATRICVGIPIYNEEQYIAETLQSLKAQDIDNVHFLVTDNHSTDRTLDICHQVIGDDERFSLIQQKENIGASENFKFALYESQSDYFMWLGGHDFLSDKYIETAIKTLDNSPQVSMICGQPYAVMDSVIKGVVKDAIYVFSDDNPLARYVQSAAMLNNCTIFHSLFRRKALDGFDFRTTISADHVAISRLLWHGRLEYMEHENYYRRYFGERAVTQDERISGSSKRLSRQDFFKFYLDDFGLLYKGDKGTKKRWIGEILGVLEKRFGA